MKKIIFIGIILLIILIAPLIIFGITSISQEKKGPIIKEFGVNEVKYKNMVSKELIYGTWVKYEFPPSKNYALWRETLNPTNRLLIRFSENGKIFPSKLGYVHHMTTGAIWLSIESGSEVVTIAYIQ